MIGARRRGRGRVRARRPARSAQARRARRRPTSSCRARSTAKTKQLDGYAELKKAADEADERDRSINRLLSAKVVPGARAARARRDPDHEPHADDDRGHGEADRQRPRARSEQAVPARLGSDARLAVGVHRHAAACSSSRAARSRSPTSPSSRSGSRRRCTSSNVDAGRRRARRRHADRASATTSSRSPERWRTDGDLADRWPTSRSMPTQRKVLVFAVDRPAARRCSTGSSSTSRSTTTSRTAQAEHDSKVATNKRARRGHPEVRRAARTHMARLQRDDRREPEGAADRGRAPGVLRDAAAARSPSRASRCARWTSRPRSRSRASSRCRSRSRSPARSCRSSGSSRRWSQKDVRRGRRRTTTERVEERERIVSIENLALGAADVKNREIILTAKFTAVTFRQEDQAAAGRRSRARPHRARLRPPPTAPAEPPTSAPMPSAATPAGAKARVEEALEEGRRPQPQWRRRRRGEDARRRRLGDRAQGRHVMRVAGSRCRSCLLAACGDDSAVASRRRSTAAAPGRGRPPRARRPKRPGSRRSVHVEERVTEAEQGRQPIRATPSSGERDFCTATSEPRSVLRACPERDGSARFSERDFERPSRTAIRSSIRPGADAAGRRDKSSASASARADRPATTATPISSSSGSSRRARSARC